jgi:hypothetical protein
MVIAIPTAKNSKNMKYPNILYSDISSLRTYFAKAHHGAIAQIGKMRGYVAIRNILVSFFNGPELKMDN